MSHTNGPWLVSDKVERAIVPASKPCENLLAIKEYEDGETYAVVAKMDDARLIAAAPQLLEACESVGRLVEIGIQKSSLESRRRGGSFGIASDESPIGKEWKALDAEERAIRDSIRAAIRAARKGE